MFDLLCAVFRHFLAINRIEADGDAYEILMSHDLTPGQRKWISEFIEVWNLAEKKPGFYEGGSMVAS